MDFIIGLFMDALRQTLVSLSHNWPYLLASVLIAGALKAFVKPARVNAFLDRFKGAGVLAATAVAVATPLCSCGTTAIVLGMMASTIPWAPIVAFMVASPLSSPDGLVYTAGLFGWPFALSHFAASILLGLGGGALAAALQKAGALGGQARFKGSETRQESAGCSCTASAAASSPGMIPIEARAAASATAFADATAATRVRAFARAVFDVTKSLLPMFVGFAFLGYLLNGLIPASVIGALFGAGHAYGVPLAATIGLPLYVNAEASLPLVKALQGSGMSQGAIMAFLIAGSGTSIGAMAGALTIARWKVVGLVVAVLWIGAIAAGYGYNGFLALGLF